MRILAVILLLASGLYGAPAKELQVFFIDVEGGQSTLVVSPSGESLLIDTGFGGNNNRDADRIVAAATAAGVKAIDYLLITHYHGDHAGGIKQLAAKLPIRRFFDRGPSQQVEEPEVFEIYKSIAEKGVRTQVKPGDTIPVPGLDVARAVGRQSGSGRRRLPGRPARRIPSARPLSPGKWRPTRTSSPRGL